MGEEEKKPAAPAETKMEEKKPEEPKKPEEGGQKVEEKPPEDKKEEKKPENSKESKEEPPPPPQEVVLKVYMHCEGCARKVRKCLKGFDGVEDVITDCKTSKVIVKGEKAAADPLKVLARVQRKSHRQVELISPIPKPPSEEEKKAAEEKEKPKPEEKKEEPPAVVIVVLRVYMHCEACAMAIKRRIQRMKGVESAEPDLKSSQVTVKGVFEPLQLVDYVYKRTGKHAVIVKGEPEKKEEEKGKESKEGKKEEEGDKEKKEEEKKETKEGESGGGDGQGGGEAKPEAAAPAIEETKVVEIKRNEYYFNPPRYPVEMYQYAYQYPPAPPIFSDENPNACSVM